LAAAESLLAGGRRPKEANLRRAQSTLYYAMFHCLARSCADGFVGGANAVRSRGAWRQTYRALEHGFTKNACKDRQTLAKFPKHIEDFANAFVILQERRHSADYDPLAKLTKSEVVADIEFAASVIEQFGSAPIKDRRAFAAHVLFKKR
jgi:uncharacterized protein (UPF0332 family)